jgi:3-deoxy-D-manno-octulosonic-acid transferase
LVARGGAFPVNTKAEFVSVCDKLLGDAMYLKTTSDICLNYVHENQGATQMIISYLKEKKFGIRLSTSSKTKL